MADPESPQELARLEQICLAMEQGNSMARACKVLSIPLRTVQRRVRQSGTWKERIEDARAAAVEVWVDQMLTVKDRWKDPKQQPLARIEAENLRWLIGRLGGETYMDKSRLDVKVEKADITQAIAEGQKRALQISPLPAPTESSETIVVTTATNVEPPTEEHDLEDWER